MPKLEDLYRAKGYTDADLQAIAPLLTDPRYRAVLEETLGALETGLATATQRNEDWRKYIDDVANPTLAKRDQEMVEWRLRATKAEEQVKIAKEYGLPTADPDTPPPPAAVVPPTDFDPKAHNLVTQPALDSLVARFSDFEGDAIAMAYDLGAEYSALYGGRSLLDYQGAEGTVSAGKRGMRALRLEAVAEAKRLGRLVALDEYVAQKFKFADKRAEAVAAREKAHDDAVRAEERTKMANEYGNPALRHPVASHQPYIPAKVAIAEGALAQTSDQLKAARIERAVQKGQATVH